eukprot:3507466-Rhodomonas_salina.1
MEVPKKQIKELQRGVEIHTAKNVLKKKINSSGQPYKHKARCSFRGFTQKELFDFHETFAAVASAAV